MSSSTDKPIEYLIGLLRELLSLPSETEWVEFKRNKINPQEIGEYISALSNSAALNGKAKAYMIWGIDDKTHEVEGTRFKPSLEKKGNEELENWLLRLLKPKINFKFYSIEYDDKPVVILEIARAHRHPVRFQNIDYIRVGSYKKKLKDYAEKERTLWRVFDETPFEEMVAKERVNDETVLKLLDYPSYFDLMDLALPENRAGILERLMKDELITVCDAGGWNITNLGAVLFAKNLEDFKRIRRKAMRVVVYKDNTRVETVREQEGAKGYACGFEGLIGFVNNLLPRNEVINEALREEVPMYPELAVRELVANALIHQDFFATGTGPMVEIFSDRMEITNPGVPLVDTNRFLDSPPRSRNEMLASMMRRIGICEERGSGIDKVVFQTEFYQLPPPRFEATDSHTCCILFAHKAFKEMRKEEKVWACYLHCCLRYVNREDMNNTSLRERLGVDERNSASVSRIIRQTVDAGLIRLYDSSANRKAWRYVPCWA
ncbi:MAG: ATP-binding protein [Marinicella pacifica]